ncbi:MAG: HlyD family efflux transporter periplasmic adaptor subunit [Legionella sp.]|uniref:HlyD family secretion protein n=1 Tax=Legionella sp. TaxID=459 RepID=UPI0039E431C3
MNLMIFTLVACQQHHEQKNFFNGYIDTDLIYLSSDFSGRLIKLEVQRGQLVQPDQFLFGLEQTRERYNVQMSQLNTQDLQAQRQQVLTQLQYNQINYDRTLGMRKQNVASQNDLDVAKKDLDASKQRLAEIDSKIKINQVDTAERKWETERKNGYSGSSGIVFDTYYTPGEFVQAGSPILSLISKDNIKAIFFVPEIKLSRLKLNQKVRLLIDNSSQLIEGHISYISNIAQYTSPLIYSREERQQLVFRIEAKIDTPQIESIHLGQPVSVELE